MTNRFANLEDGCKEYVSIIMGPRNGLGGYNSPDGQSHDTLRKLYNQFDTFTVDNEVSRQLKAKTSC